MPMNTVEWQPRRKPPKRRGRLFIVIVLGILVLASGTALSYYVDRLWYESLGYADVFWKTLGLQSEIFVAFFAASFLILYLAFLAIKPKRLGEFSGIPILINGQPLQLPIEPVLRIAGIAGAGVIAFATAAGMMSEWTTLALYWSGAGLASPSVVDPIFSKPIAFYLFTLPAYGLLSGWLLTIAVVVTAVGGFFAVVTSGTRAVGGTTREESTRSWRGLSIAFAGLLLVIAWRVYLGRFDRLLQDHTIFAGVTYTEAHVTLTGLLAVSVMLVVGAALALVNAVAAPKLRWLIAAVVPAAVTAVIVGVIGAYTNAFIVKPNELVRERPYIAHNIEMTRRAFALNDDAHRAFPADTGVEALNASDNQETLRNIRLWDWRALQDTLRQIQEIRTYYDFPDIDIDRYTIDGSTRQMMLAARELSIDKLPESSRNWINEKLIYTHGYGVTMNPVNGFTAEGMPDLILKDMPVQSSIPSLKITRPEIYFGEMTNTDVYVKTRQKEFNYPQGESNVVTTYEGNGGIVVGGFFRRLLIALDRGDLAKLPFSDDVNAESRLLMRRNIRERVSTLAPFLTFDDDPYIIVGEDGRLTWMLDGYTTADSYPYARHDGFQSVADQLHTEQHQSHRGCLRRHHVLLCVRLRGSDHRRLPAAVSVAVQGRCGDAAATPRARPLSRTDAAAAGKRLQPVPHDRSGSVLQPGGLVDDPERGRHERAQRAGRPGDGTKLSADEVAGRGCARIRGDAAVHAVESQQSDRLDRRAQRRGEVRDDDRLRFSEEPAG